MGTSPNLPEPHISSKATASLIVAAGIVLVVLIFFPAYRLFFGISVGIGVVVAGILHLWNKYKPIKEDGVRRDDNRPLGL